MKNQVNIRGTVTAVSRFGKQGNVFRLWVKTPNVDGTPKYSTHAVECFENKQEIERGYYVDIIGSLSSVKTPSGRVATIIRPTTINVLSKTC